MREDVLETKYEDPPKPSCSIALVALGRKWVGRQGFFVDEGLVCPGLVGE